MAITFRPAAPDDLSRTAEIFAAAIDDLNRKHGFFEEPTPTTPVNPQYAFWLKKDPHAYWVAESGNHIVGYSYSFLRGSLWFLADLFIQPSFQGRGIGRALIEKTLGSWEGHTITNRALITPAFNRASVSLYMRFGMLPRQPVYFAVASAREVVKTLGSKHKGNFKVEELADTRRISAELDRVHEDAVGFAGGWNCEYFSHIQKASCLLFKTGNRLEGYAFVRKNGRIGNLVVRSSKAFRGALDATLRFAAESGADELTIFFAGTNRDASAAAISHGFRITYPLLFLSQQPMGDWNNYMFYSPGLM